MTRSSLGTFPLPSSSPIEHQVCVSSGLLSWTSTTEARLASGTQTQHTPRPPSQAFPRASFFCCQRPADSHNCFSVNFWKVFGKLDSKPHSHMEATQPAGRPRVGAVWAVYKNGRTLALRSFRAGPGKGGDHRLGLTTSGCNHKLDRTRRVALCGSESIHRVVGAPSPSPPRPAPAPSCPTNGRPHLSVPTTI